MTAPSATKVAQVRLRPDEMAALEAVVRRMNLASNSEALREGLRLLIREAAELEAADEIRTHYAGDPVPLPDGVAPATDAELRAADEARW
jgi:Arc/MetJ-type ribon-helix-helix transcriptional regulator